MSYSKNVQAWYADPSRWKAQGKFEEWADRILIDQGELLRGKHVLNLGCFYPEDEARFMHMVKSWTAIDFTPEVIDWCRSWLGWPSHVRFGVADMRAMPFEDEFFDVVLDFSSGDHLSLEDYQKTLKEVWRVLRPLGHFAVTFTNRDNMVDPYWRKHTFKTTHFGYERADTFPEMRAMLERAGLPIGSSCSEEKTRTGILCQKAGR
jgi:ubiquinone/menaquinone biosynthesis C-methylase UbiE